MTTQLNHSNITRLMQIIKTAKEVAKAIPESARCVLLGECTHGTQEFYTYRAEITKWLIENRYLIHGTKQKAHQQTHYIND